MDFLKQEEWVYFKSGVALLYYSEEHNFDFPLNSVSLQPLEKVLSFNAVVNNGI